MTGTTDHLGSGSDRRAAVPTSLTRRNLDEGWTVRATQGPIPEGIALTEIPAQVPGSVHTDLMAAGLIRDPYLDSNENAQKWVGLTDWSYRTTFDWDADGHTQAQLLFEGLDTVARISLNGTELGSTHNMHRSYRFNTEALLVAGENQLDVDFSSPVRHADAQSLSLGYRPHVNHHPYNAMRKMACSFGWDWGPDTATSAIWKPVLLETWSIARLASVRPIATITGVNGTVAVHVEIERAELTTIDATESVTDGVPLCVRVSLPDLDSTVEAVISPGQSSVTVEVSVEQPDLWWPRGMGDQALYNLHTELLTSSPDSNRTSLLDSNDRRIGFRRVEIDTTADSAGTPFAIRINGRAITVRGANWIPDDAFLHRVTRERISDRLDQAEFGRINLLRVWGGGIYESDHFYDLCDERGMLTWQDFLLACAAYAEEAPLSDEIAAEARENVSRLSTHPSLVIWNGNNENLWGHEDWRWKPQLDGRTWGHGYYYSLFPDIVSELAPHTAYTPGSPFSPDPTMHPNDPHHGTVHEWDVWNKLDYTAYTHLRPRFVSEFGWQGPPTWATMTRAISDNPLTPESPGMQVHQKAIQGNQKLIDGLVPHLRLPDNLDDWHWAMSLNQAVAVRFGIEHFRSLQPVCTGTIMWQLNDCWPVTSWAAVDGDGRRKPLLFALREAHADRLLTIQPRDSGLAAVVVNDAADAWVGRLVVERRTFAGEILARQEIHTDVPSGSAISFDVASEIQQPSDPKHEYLRIEQDGHVARRLFVEWRDATLGTAPVRTRDLVETTLTSEGARHRLQVRALGLVGDLSLLIDRIDPAAVVDRMLVTLDAGESTVFEFTSTVPIDHTALLHPTVLRSVNDIGGAPRR